MVFHTLMSLQVALVGQEPILFARTVEENITYGLSDVPMEAVVQAATKANAHDFISTLPKGYETSNYLICLYVNQLPVYCITNRKRFVLVYPLLSVHHPTECTIPGAYLSLAGYVCCIQFQLVAIFISSPRSTAQCLDTPVT